MGHLRIDAISELRDKNIGQKGSDSGLTCVHKRECMVESEEKTLHLPREVPSFLLNALPSWENKLKKKKNEQMN